MRFKITDLTPAEIEKANQGQVPTEHTITEFTAPHYKAAKEIFSKLCADSNWNQPNMVEIG